MINRKDAAKEFMEKMDYDKTMATMINMIKDSEREHVWYFMYLDEIYITNQYDHTLMKKDAKRFKDICYMVYLGEL